ncbi:hypothetical protein [Candidatus Laterigemmans baculatus]|uniref:hypothetical protein n=1 Tax=Candidatus Laterigemmans baculatus TaxID=2770505 RepID=UPI0013D9BFF7|nr:hypothetical protein [Candidatus Laterigemmans baculatus]
MKNLALALIALLVAPSLAFAGESNSKDDPYLIVKNRTDYYVLVVLDDGFNEDMLDALEPDDPEDQMEEFEDAGGTVLEPGESAKFEVKAGKHTVNYFILYNGVPDGPEDFDEIKTTVREGKDRTVYINGEVFYPTSG